MLYEDSKFYELYLTELQRLTEKNYLEDIITKNKEEFLNNKRLLEKNFPTSDVFSLEHFQKVRKIIRNTINPIQGINAYFSDLKNDHVQLSIQNLQRLPVVLKGVKLNNGEEIFLNNEIIVKGKKHNKPLENFQLKIPCNISQAKKKIKPIQCDKFLDTSQKFFSANNKLIFNILGQETYQEEIINRFYKNEEVYSKKKEIFDISKLSNISFLNIDLKRKEINFNSNQITVRDKLVFPSGYFVNFHPGTEIILSDEGQLISYSPIKMIGTQSNPIIIKSNFNGSLKKYRNLKEFKNEYNFGNGLLVMNAKGESIIKHTIFKNIGAPEIESGVGLMGAINLYRSNVIIENSKFIENLRGDDFLNIISSNFHKEYYNGKYFS